MRLICARAFFALYIYVRYGTVYFGKNTKSGLLFEGAHTAVALVLSMYMEGGPTEEQLISPEMFKRAFAKLGVLARSMEAGSG